MRCASFFVAILVGCGRSGYLPVGREASLPTGLIDFEVSGVQWPTHEGLFHSVRVEARSSTGILTDYIGSITFSATDSAAVLPSPYTFQSDDNGVAIFTEAVAFNTLGTHSLVVRDGAATGSQDGIQVLVRQIFRSVGPNQIDPVANGTDNAMTIDGIMATFAAPLPSKVGVGDVIQYDTNRDNAADTLAFVHYRHGAQAFVVKTADDERPAQVNEVAGWTLFRAYTSLDDVNGGVENLGIDDALEDFDDRSSLPTDLFARDRVLNIACYADAPDVLAGQTELHIDEWVTSPSHYIRLFTPVDLTEVGVSQRHRGTWSSSGYRLERPAVSDSQYDGTLIISSANVRVEGLQILTNQATGIVVSGQVENTRIAYSIVRGSGGIGFGIRAGGNTSTLRIWNNIIYDASTDDGDGIWLDGAMTAYV